MVKLTPREQKIVSIAIEKGILASSAIYGELIKSEKDISLITIKRDLTQLVNGGLLIVSGGGRSTSYRITAFGRIFANINAKEYCEIDPDKRFGLERYNFDLLNSFRDDIFTENELLNLETATAGYKRRTSDLPAAIQKREMERLIVELSWKSSKIEGNTYTLLETEKLILENKEAVGRGKNEAKMILNHKEAFNFIRENINEFKNLNRGNLEKLHSILVKDLGVGLGLRSNPVGITGTKYRPLENIYQIQEAVESLSAATKKMKTAYAKALLAIIGISYIHPFEDGNKRTGRLMANGLLLAHQKSPLSYRSVDEEEYRQAIIVFYEINSILPFKKIFLDQYEFAANNYSVAF